MPKYQVKTTWQRSRPQRRVKFKPCSRYMYEQTYTTHRYLTDFEGEVEVTIDLNAILAQISRTAGYNKSGKATLLSGMVKAKRLRERQTQEKVVVFTTPPEDAEIISEETLP